MNKVSTTTIKNTLYQNIAKITMEIFLFWCQQCLPGREWTPTATRRKEPKEGLWLNGLTMSSTARLPRCKRCKKCKHLRVEISNKASSGEEAIAWTWTSPGFPWTDTHPQQNKKKKMGLIVGQVHSSFKADSVKTDHLLK